MHIVSRRTHAQPTKGKTGKHSLCQAAPCCREAAASGLICEIWEMRRAGSLARNCFQSPAGPKENSPTDKRCPLLYACSEGFCGRFQAGLLPASCLRYRARLLLEQVQRVLRLRCSVCPALRRPPCLVDLPPMQQRKRARSCRHGLWRAIVLTRCPCL